MPAVVPTLVLAAGAGLALWSGWRSRNTPHSSGLTALWTSALALALVFTGLGMDFRLHGLSDHAATAFAAALSLLAGHAAGLLLLRLSPGRPVASTFGLAMTLGLPPLGAFPGLWLGLQTTQSSLLLLPAWPSLLHVAAALAALAGWVRAWQVSWNLLEADSPPRSGAGARSIPIARGLLIILGVLAAFLPWIWVLPAQVLAASLTGELPVLLVALGMMLAPLIPGQASVIPFGILAIAMAVSSVLLLVLRLTRRQR